jgi:hypothetical protein
VLLCALLLVHENEVVVYEEGRFVTELDSATFERMIKRPEDYRLQGCRVAGERQAVLARFAAGLLKGDAEPTLVNVVRALYRQFSRLPEYTMKTRTLPAEASALRDVFKEGREPEQLLFVQLPRLLGARPFVADEDAGSANVEAFFARWNPAMRAVVGAYDALLSRLKATLCQSFGVGDGHELRARALAILPFVTEARLKAFALRAAEDGTDARKWLESVAAGVVGRRRLRGATPRRTLRPTCSRRSCRPSSIPNCCGSRKTSAAAAARTRRRFGRAHRFPPCRHAGEWFRKGARRGGVPERRAVHQ